MKKAEELANKHLDLLNANNIVGKDGNIYKGFINAINEALNLTDVVASVLCVNSNGYGYIKEGVEYPLIKESQNYYTIKNSDNEEYEYKKELFVKSVK